MKLETTNLTAWNGGTYSGLGGKFDLISELDTEQDLDTEERLRLAIWCWNNHETPTAENLAKLIGDEQEAFYGENTSEADFTENLVRETEDLSEMPLHLVIDWQATWDSAFRFDFFTYDVITQDCEYKKFFWRAY